MAVNPLKSILAKADALARNSILSVPYSFGKSKDDVGLEILSEMKTALINGTANRTELSLRLFDWLMGDKPRTKGVFHPSEICDEDSWCRRKYYYDIAQIKADSCFVSAADLDNQLQRIFDIGTFIHFYIQNSLRKAGILKQAEVPVQSAEYGVGGHTDGVLHGSFFKTAGDILLEIKSMNTMQFYKLVAPVEKQVKQASIYAHFLGLDKILMLYYDKNTSAMKDYLVDVDIAFVERFKTLAKEIMSLRTQNLRRTRTTDITQHQLPSRVCHASTCKRAQSCPYTSTCFAMN